MSEPTAPQGTPASTTPATTPATTVANAQPVQPAAAADDPNNPKWLPGRLAQAERGERDRIFAELGISDVATAKAAIEAAKKAAEANQTAEQRAANADAEAKRLAAENAKASALVAEHAARMLMALTPEQQKAVKDFAGDNAAEQLRYIHATAPTWAAQAQAAQAAAAAAQPTTVAPVTTGPGATAPAGAAPGSPPDHRAVYQQMRATNPFASAAYGLSNPSAYETKP